MLLTSLPDVPGKALRYTLSPYVWARAPKAAIMAVHLREACTERQRLRVDSTTCQVVRIQLHGQRTLCANKERMKSMFRRRSVCELPCETQAHFVSGSCRFRPCKRRLLFACRLLEEPTSTSHSQLSSSEKMLCITDVY